METCRRGDTIRFGELLAYSNFWGAPVGERETAVCIRALSSESFRWNWSRPSPTNEVPIYPEVIWGKKVEFALQEDSTTKKLPVAIASLISLKLSLSVTTRAEGEYDLAFDIWITNSSTGYAHALSPTHEIMIWLRWTPGLRWLPPDTHGTVNDGHATYVHRCHRCRQYVWELHIFTLQDQEMPTMIDFVPFFHHLMIDRMTGEDYLPLRYLSSIEFGNEVWFGNGETIVAAYHFDVKATMQSLENGTSSTTIELESLYAPFLTASLTIPQISTRKVPCDVFKPNSPWRRAAGVLTAL